MSQGTPGVPDPNQPHQVRKYYGKVKAFCRDNADPQKRGRIRCYCPQVMGPLDDTQHWLHWAEPNFPWLGGINTLDFGPPTTKAQNGGVETGIWLEFEQGDPDFPIWTGTWLPAPTPSDPNAQQDLTNAGAPPGGDIIPTHPNGSNLSALNPLEPQPNTNETRLLVKAGREIIIESVGGGSIAIGPYGVSVQGPQVLLNGRFMTAAVADKVTG